MNYRCGLLIFFIACQQIVFAQSNIRIDGDFSDWEDVEVLYDNSLSGQTNRIKEIKVINDDRYLYCQFTVNTEIDLMDNSELGIHFDTDDNLNTGVSECGLGVELTFYFSERYGFLDGNIIFHSDINLLAMPTVTSQQFEIAIALEEIPNIGATIGICMTETNGFASEPFKYDVVQDPHQVDEFELEKSALADFRILSYNVQFDGLFDSFTGPQQEDIIRAIDPDIIAFQEIYDHPASDVKQILDNLLPNPNGWEAITFFSDVMVFTKYDVIATSTILGNEVSLLALPNNKSLAIFNVHFPCCDNDLQRQQEVDHLMSVIRDKSESFKIDFDYPDDLPYIITGDFNFVGEAQNITSILEGDIVYNSTYGEDFMPDIDGSSITDANPYNTGIASNHTWNNPFGSYVPGKLDFFFYTDSALELENTYVLNTLGLDNNTLNGLGLSRDHTTEASDHLPIVADFSFKNSVNTEDQLGFQKTIEAYPNPTDGQLNLQNTDTRLSQYYRLVSSQGELISTGSINNQSLQMHDLNAGMYLLLVLDGDNWRLIDKIIVY